MSYKTYKIRRFKNGRSKDGQTFTNYSITIPVEIASQLPDDIRFVCELTDSGILFRPAEKEETGIELPSWAKNTNGSTHT